MKPPRFLMYGIHGVYNYGCEALVRGTETILREIWPHAIIKYASSRPEDDRRRLRNSSVEIVPRVPKQYPKYCAANICRKLAFSLGVSWYPIKEELNWLDDCDVVLSIGGDLYTLRTSGDFNRDLVRLGDIVRKRGKKFVIWGASVGPFDENKQAKKIISKHLSKVELITSRESASAEYLKSMGIENNVVECSDPAFAVLPEATVEVSRNGPLRIGINLSPLSIRFISDPHEYQFMMAKQARSITRIIKEIDSEVLLIPHVVCDFDEDDDDFRYLQIIKSMLPQEVTGRVRLLEKDLGFLGTKSELLRCNLVIAARMHCAINSIASCLPTILLSYSQKSVGMARYVYGDDRWVIQMGKWNSDSVLNLIRDMVDEKEDIGRYLKKRLYGIQADARVGAKALAEIISGGVSKT